ncbi:hypothetical protein NIES4106_44610 [Fischerella sp. NIES-4106]|jgi:hypothetical protein|nr:hypothetical protein NIES4106_44610 [Fischerella sp. NIES-4106]
MNRKLALFLLSSPALFASMLSMVMMTQPARANQTVNSTQTHVSCLESPHSATRRLVCTRVSNTPAALPKPEMKLAQNNNSSDIVEMNFSEEESDTAISLFGCDCPSCINALRQMRGQTPMPV